jgi:hypothetical protein
MKMTKVQSRRVYGHADGLHGVIGNRTALGKRELYGPT